MASHDGGAAFPIVTPDGQDWNIGLSARDYFAAKAMQALIVNPTTCSVQVPLSLRAYEIADAMLRARTITREK